MEEPLETSAPDIVSFEYEESMEVPVSTGALDFGPPGADESLEFAGHDALTTSPEEEERSLVHEEEMKPDVLPAGEDIEPPPAAYRPVIEQAAEVPVARFAEAPATTIEQYLVALLEYTPGSAGDGNAASGGADKADQAGAGERDELDEFQNWLSGLG